LAEELKAATFLSHARLQELPFFQALVACQLPLESYVGQLRALAVIHGALEQALATCTDQAVASVWQSDMRKLSRLQEDLSYFEPRVVADIAEAAGKASVVAEQIRLQSLQSPLSLLGWVYVLEGSTLGAMVLRPLFARAFLLTREDGLSYLHSYGPATHSHWTQFQQRLNALALTVEERERVVKTADECFEQLRAVFQALYPFQPDSLTYLATSLNPEAGRHPVPADVREVHASVQAADLCWQQFPYYEFRYGERGRRFARSDGAWLATLYQFAPSQIRQQVLWLGRVLCSRGMPTLMLQCQLEILFDQMARAIPEKRSEYEKLLEGAATLQAARRKHFDDEQSQALSLAFNRAVGPDWSEKYKNAGELLVGAVADELQGIEGAVENIRQWMTDPARFPAEWIAAVQAILAQARQQARRSAEGSTAAANGG
jgi:heme oxygenase